MGSKSSSTQIHPHEKQRHLKSQSKTSSIDFTTSDQQNWLNLIEKLTSNKPLNDYVLSKDRTKFNSLNELKEFLQRAPFKNDVEKAWVIFVWITHNIRYDFDGLINNKIGDQDTAAVFKTGKSVCAGYGKLSNELFDALGLRSVVISGYSKGYNYEIGQKFIKTDHEWNAVYVDSKWRLFESTWGAGHVKGNEGYVMEFTPHYFFIPPEIFIMKHFPEKREYQYLSKPISMHDYEVMPSYKLPFFIHGFKCLTHNKSIIKPESNIFKMEFSAPKGTKIIGHIEDNKRNKIENSVLVQRDYKSNNIIVEVAVQSNDRATLCLFGGKNDNKSFESICDYIIKPKRSINKAFLFCEQCSTPATEVFLYQPIENNLKLGQEYTFQIHADALEVALITSNKGWIYLKKDSDNIWTVKYKPETKGPLNLSAKCTTGNSYSSTFIYNVL